MSIFRSYFEKNNTLIEPNDLNVSQNPVGEISYGTVDDTVSRIIFKIDLADLQTKLSDEGITIGSIGSHRLKMTNTIVNRRDLLGGYSYVDEIIRASSFELELFELIEDWDEGAGYSFSFANDDVLNLPNKGASNWQYRKTGIRWAVPGAYISSGMTGVTATTGTTRILGTQIFPKGNENIDIDLTDYINDVLFSGTTHLGIGIKFKDNVEALQTNKRNSVAFHMNNTNTFFEPFLETIINDRIVDDRNFFYMDKENKLFLYSSRGDVDVSGVTIYDFNHEIIDFIPTSGVTRHKKGIYSINYTVNSEDYPDAVIFKDVWTVTQNSKIKDIFQDFYLVNSENYYNFDLTQRINSDNYYFSYFGIKHDEYIKRGDKRRIDLIVKELYRSQDYSLPLDIEYRLFIKQGDDVHIDIIPFTKVDITKKGYEFVLDTTWLIPQDYYIELKLINENLQSIKSPIRFTIVGDDAFTR